MTRILSVSATAAALCLSCWAADTKKSSTPDHSTTQTLTGHASIAFIRRSDGAQVTDNKTFQFANVLHDDGAGYTRLLLLKGTRNEHVDGREQTAGHVQVQAWTLRDDGTRKKRWHLKVTGNSVEALEEDRFIRVTQWGCCDWPHISTYFSLLSGRKLYISNSNLLSVNATEGGPTTARYVAFGYSAQGQPPILQYGSDARVMQRFLLLTPHEYHDRPRVLLVANGEAGESLVLKRPLTFAILLRYADGKEVQVPVQNDVLQTDEISLPEGYSLQRTDLESR